jgi:uncharacterized protein YndB with AHSA1/START domain
MLFLSSGQRVVGVPVPMQQVIGGGEGVGGDGSDDHRAGKVRAVTPSARLRTTARAPDEMRYSLSA